MELAKGFTGTSELRGKARRISAEVVLPLQTLAIADSRNE